MLVAGRESGLGLTLKSNVALLSRECESDSMLRQILHVLFKDGGGGGGDGEGSGQEVKGENL
jgi:hypothetical protein